MKNVEGQKFKNKVLKASIQEATEEDHRNRFLNKANKKKGKKNAEEDVDPNITPAERLANQVTPLHK
jgi:hypothetical protein